MELYFHSISNLTEARFAASVYPKYIGFCFDESSPFYVSPLTFSKIQPWLTGATIVAQFGYTSAEKILETAQLLAFTVVEVPHDHPGLAKIMAQVEVVLQSNTPVSSAEIRVPFPPNEKHEPIPHAFYEMTQDLERNLEWIRNKAPYGIALKGFGAESEPGMADLSVWSELMEALEIL
jgi:hypothetical protein